MSKQYLSKIPKSTELQPIPSTAAKLWNAVSLLLTFSGIGLMGFGGWMYIQLQIEANQPPPARIVAVTVERNPVSTATPTPPPTSTRAQPTAAAVESEINAASSLSDTLDLEDSAGDADPALIEEVVFVAEATAVVTAVVTAEIESVEIEAPALETPTPVPEPTEETDPTLSLADNPLVVVDKTQAEAAPVDQTAAEPAPEQVEPISSSPTERLFINRIVAESIGLDAEVIEVGWQPVVQNGVETNVWVVADYAAGWHKNSALPGENGNIVLSAHHNIKGEVFRYTIDLEPGAVVTLYDQENRAYDYVIEDKFIVKDKGEPESVRRANAKWIGAFNEERLTLVTCWPYSNNTHRAIVIGKPVGE